MSDPLTPEQRASLVAAAERAVWPLLDPQTTLAWEATVRAAEERIAALEAALKPLAALIDALEWWQTDDTLIYNYTMPGSDGKRGPVVKLTLGDIRRAAEVLRVKE